MRGLMLVTGLALALVAQAGSGDIGMSVRRLSVEEYRDRMAGAWMGQSVGVAYGAPTEFRKNGEAIFSDAEIPKWTPERVNNTFEQDDLYVEMTFLATLENRGIDVGCREAGIDFANSTYRLWCANANARDNLRRGIAAPSSSHPKNHPTTDDIDYQIEADFSGILAPGLPSRVLRFGETFGRIMNYGDGLYAGEFVGAMYAAAYFERDRVKTVEAGLEAIPAGSGYAAMVRDVLAWYKADPKDWRKAWRLVVDAYGRDRGPRMGCVSSYRLDVKTNGAMVLLGYLWGEGDVWRTMHIATACGYDSDCNPSTALGVLGVQIGLKGFGPEYISKFNPAMKWEHTDYDWTKLLAVSERLTRQIVVAEGGRIERDDRGECFVIPVKKVEVGPVTNSADPGPGGDDRLDATENAQIRFRPCTSEGAASVPKSVKPGIAVRSGDAIAFLGDSITQYGNRPNGYVSLVMDALELLGVKAQRIAAGVSGNRSNDMLARVDHDCLSKHPAFMTLSCGVNDVWHADWGKGVSLEEYRRNISAILDKAAAAGVEVVVLTPTLIGEDSANEKNRRLDAYAGWLREEALRRGLRLADLNMRMREHLHYLRKRDRLLGGTGEGNQATVDGVHMNYHGDMMMACGVLDALGVSQAQMDRVWTAWRKRPGTRTAEFFNDEKVAMRDGVKLAVDVYLPSNRTGKVGCWLSFSPYGATRPDQPQGTDRAEAWGVAAVFADCRGLCHSEGRFETWESRLVDDADDLLNWIAAQPWCNGRVVMTGGSYPGHTQLAAMRSGNPALVACAPGVITLDPDTINFRNGVLVTHFMREWHEGLAGRESWLELTRHPTRDAWWRERMDRRNLSKSGARAFYQAGWYDLLGFSTFSTFKELPEGSVLRVGPWNHGVNTFDTKEIDYGKRGGLVTEDDEIEFLRSALEGRESASRKWPGRILLYVMGRDTWRYENEWPLARTVWREMDFTCGETRSFAHDPKRPVPACGGRMLGGLGGRQDQREVERNPGVLSYTGEELAEDLEVTGEVSAKLSVSSTAACSDVTVKLVDVFPDGRAINVVDGICRVNFTPGAVKSVEFPVDSTAYVFLKGHRVRVDVAGSAAGNYEVCPMPATVTVHAGSRLVLPVIPPASESR